MAFVSKIRGPCEPRLWLPYHLKTHKQRSLEKLCRANGRVCGGPCVPCGPAHPHGLPCVPSLKPWAQSYACRHARRPLSSQLCCRGRLESWLCFQASDSGQVNSSLPLICKRQQYTQVSKIVTTKSTKIDGKSSNSK